MGVEIEVGGISLDEVASACSALLGGSSRATSTYTRHVDSDWGAFRIELDAAPLQKVGQELGDSPTMASWVEVIANQMVPTEIITPPIPRAQIPQLDRLCDELRALGAQGTGDGIRWALGVHFNPELPSPRGDIIRRHMQAFAVLYPHLLERGRVDLSRRLSPYIEPFPTAYVRKLLAPAYAPDVDRLIDDYLTHNATRNRALDMLPLFRHLAPERVDAAVGDELVKARPTFHYRLANCALERPEWSVSHEWVAWVAVETLARDETRLRRACRHFLDALDDSWRTRLMGEWRA